MNQRQLLRRATLAATLILSGMLVACASTPAPPTAEMQTARDAIDNAEDARAAQEAPLELRKARERLKAANDAIENEDMESARRYAREATLLAELAVARTEMVSARRTNKELETTTEMLLEEMQRGRGETS